MCSLKELFDLIHMIPDLRVITIMLISVIIILIVDRIAGN